MSEASLPDELWRPPPEFDGFKVLRELGEGGMGRVYLGHELLLDRRVALKFIAATEPDPAARRRFLVEAQAIARLQHPNVVAIYRIGEVGGRPYIAYEFIEGVSLERLPRPQEWRKVLEIGLGIARGLAAAHRRGVLHRDIKPGNIMLSEQGEVKLLDFGIAKLTGGEDALPLAADGATPIIVSRPGGLDLRTTLSGTALPLPEAASLAATAPRVLTQAGSLVGTPRYLAPELWEGALASPRSDIYSLGLVLYELCGGQVARGEGGAEPGREAPRTPLCDAAPAVPEALAHLVERCTQTDPLARPLSAAEVRDELEALAAGPSAPVLEAGLATPETRYTRNGSVNIAYQVFGTGPADLVFVPGFVSHLEVSWEEPHFARFLRRLTSFGRVITFDKRGTGLSDRVTEHPSIAERMDDLRAVMDAAGSERAVIFGVSEGACMAAVFGATYPQRSRALILYGGSGRPISTPEHPEEGSDPAFLEWVLVQMRERWGEPLFAEEEAPSLVHDEAFRRWWARYLKMSASPGAAVSMLSANFQIDITGLLPSIRVPTLVLHRAGDRLMPAPGARRMASLIAGAKYVELPGADHVPFAGDVDRFFDEIELFLAQARPSPGTAPMLTTVAVVRGAAGAPGWGWRDALARWQGTELVAPTGDVVGMFNNPADAVRCACETVEEGARRGLALRAGATVGELRLQGGELVGRALEVAADLAAQAPPGEVLLSAALHDLVRGEPFLLEEIGAARIFRARPLPVG